MIFHRLKSLITAAALGVTCILALFTGEASAAYTHKLLFSFGPISLIDSVAVDDSTGDIYVLAGAIAPLGKLPSLYKFNAAGEPANFAATGSNLIANVEGEGCPIAVDNSTGPAKGDIYVATCKVKVPVYSSSGELIGELNEKVTSEIPGAPWEEVHDVAIDRQGHVYLAFNQHNISKYTPAANPVKNTDYTSSLWELPVVNGIAVDSEGSVWDSVFKFSASQFNTSGSRAISETRIPETGSLAVDLSTNELYVDQGSGILVYESGSGRLIENFKPPGGAGAIALDGSNNDLYAAGEHGQINVFGPRVLLPDVSTESPGFTTSTVILKGSVNPDGMEADCYFEYGASTSYGQTVPCTVPPGSGATPVPVQAEAPGLSPGVFYHYRLVATNENGSNPGGDDTFALPVAPVIEGEVATSVAISTAEVEGSIMAMGFETSVHVEFGTDTNYGSILPMPDAEIGSDVNAKTVGQFLTGLLPETTYHYRFAATNVNGTAYGPDRTFTTFAFPSQLATDTCPNAVYRTGLSANLPDCRAYEMASPVDKNGSDIVAWGRDPVTASESGGRVAFLSGTGMVDTHGSGAYGFSQYVAARTADGWSTKGVTPTPAPNSASMVFSAFTWIFDFSDELERAVALGYDLPGVEGAKPDTENLYLEDMSDSQLLATITNASSEGTDFKLFWGQMRPELGGSSSDMNVVSFDSQVNYVPEAKGTVPKVYAFEGGEVKLVGVLPNGSVPAGGSALARGEEKPASSPTAGNALRYRDTVSRDGSRIFFLSPASGSEQQLYMRKEGTTSVLVSQSEESTPTTAQNVHFQAASPDGTNVVFSTTSRLVDSDPGGTGTTALYLYTDSPSPETESNLTFIARSNDVSRTEASEEQLDEKVVKGISEDASHIYFINEDGLYLWDAGQVQQVAPTNRVAESIVSADGRQIAFASTDKHVTGNEIVSFGSAPDGSTNSEVYVYGEGRNTLTCVSCPQNGTAVTSGTQRDAGAESGLKSAIERVPRFFTSDGHYVFFSTSEALVAQDTNGVTDAYEYDTVTGKLSLLSPGIGEDGTWFVDASADGRDVFLATRQKLSLWDPDKLVDIYDARAGGGLPGPPAVPAPCEGDECQGTPSAVPGFDTASGFEGLGNPTFAPSAQAKERSLSNSQRLKRALAACRRRSKRKRMVCEAAARKHYRAGKSSGRKPRTER